LDSCYKACVGRKTAAATASAASAPASSQVAGSPWGDATESLARRHGSGLAVKVCRLLLCVGVPSGSSSNDLSMMTRMMWVVARWCAGGANAIVNYSDASSLLYRPAEATHVYTV